MQASLPGSSTTSRSCRSSAGAATALDREVEVGEARDRLTELVLGVIARLGEGLLGGERVHLQLSGRIARTDPLGIEATARLDAPDMRGKAADQHQDLARARPGR